MTANKLLLCFTIFLCQCVSAQSNAILLDEVIISDVTLREFSKSQSILTITDSTITKNNASLTDLLKFTTPIYFKENGYGMVSSPSFRGTTAQQTAVIWNGININSQFNGQTDFNTISSKSFNEIDVKSGGGSVVYGTSAIGGSIHLNNQLSFSKSQKHEVHYGFGSFNSHQSYYKLNTSTNKWSVNATIDRNSSDNDYHLPNGKKNTNGEFDNFSISASGGLKLNENHLLKIYSQFSRNNRNFSLQSASDSKTKYYNEEARNLVEWQFNNGKLQSNLKAAFLAEEYQYYENIDSDQFLGSTAETIIGKYELGYSFTNSNIKSIIEFNSTAADGSDIRNSSRTIASSAILFSQKPTSKLYYEIGARQEISNSYDSPLLFSAGSTYKIANQISVNLNASRNFRIPTFNDLHWNGVGNSDLKPESSYQVDFGTQFKSKATKLSVNLFYMDISNMIQWLPGQTSVWFPKNVQQVTSKGLEFIGNSAINIGTNQFQLSGTYSFTSSENLAGKQLIYVPKHRSSVSLAYAKSKFSSYLQFLYNGEVFTRTDNNPKYTVDEYTVANLGVSFTFKFVELGMKVQNIFDKEYFAMDRRPFPGRNYSMYLNLNF